MAMYSRLTSVSTQLGGRPTIVFCGDVSSTRQHSIKGTPLKKKREEMEAECVVYRCVRCVLVCVGVEGGTHARTDGSQPSRASEHRPIQLQGASFASWPLCCTMQSWNSVTGHRVNNFGRVGVSGS